MNRYKDTPAATKLRGVFNQTQYLNIITQTTDIDIREIKTAIDGNTKAIESIARATESNTISISGLSDRIESNTRSFGLTAKLTT